jgi:predicted kinase
MLILICGLPGVGKTTFAKELISKIDAEYVSSDSIRMKEFEERTYSQEEKDNVYTLMGEEAGRLLDLGHDVVLDATFYLEKYRAMMQDLADEYGSELKIIECFLDEKVLEERMEKRKKGGSESEADFQVYQKVAKEFERIEEKHLVINCAFPIEENVEVAVEWIQSN